MHVVHGYYIRMIKQIIIAHDDDDDDDNHQHHFFYRFVPSVIFCVCKNILFFSSSSIKQNKTKSAFKV